MGEAKRRELLGLYPKGEVIVKEAGLIQAKDTIVTPVSNLPIFRAPIGVKVPKVHGCEFNPPAYTKGGESYFTVVTKREPYIPIKGWYNNQEEGYLTWIESFQLIAVSLPNEWGAKAWLFRAIEGQPPEGVVPK